MATEGVQCTKATRGMTCDGMCIAHYNLFVKHGRETKDDDSLMRSLSDTEIVEEVISTVELDILEDIVMKSSLPKFRELLKDRGIKFGNRWYDKDDVPGVRSLLSVDIAISKEVLRLEQSNKF